MTSLWLAGSGGGDVARERVLPELLGRLEVRPSSFEYLLDGEAGGRGELSNSAVPNSAEYRWLRASSNLSICSADTIVWVPPSDIGVRGDARGRAARSLTDVVCDPASFSLFANGA